MGKPRKNELQNMLLKKFKIFFFSRFLILVEENCLDRMYYLKYSLMLDSLKNYPIGFYYKKLFIFQHTSIFF